MMSARQVKYLFKYIFYIENNQNVSFIYKDAPFLFCQQEPMYQILDLINLRNKQPHFGVEFLSLVNLSAVAWYSGNADERLGKLPLSVSYRYS